MVDSFEAALDRATSGMSVADTPDDFVAAANRAVGGGSVPATDPFSTIPSQPPAALPVGDVLDRSREYLARGIKEMTEAPREFAEPFTPPQPTEDPLEQLRLMMGSRLSQKLGPVLKGVFGAVGAAGAGIAGVAEPLVRKQLEWTGGSPGYDALRRLAPRLFPAGKDLPEKATKEISYLLGQGTVPFLPGLFRRAGLTGRKPPKIDIPSPAAEVDDFLLEQRRVENAVKRSEAAQSFAEQVEQVKRAAPPPPGMTPEQTAQYEETIRRTLNRRHATSYVDEQRYLGHRIAPPSEPSPLGPSQGLLNNLERVGYEASLAREQRELARIRQAVPDAPMVESPWRAVSEQGYGEETIRALEREAVEGSKTKLNVTVRSTPPPSSGTPQTPSAQTGRGAAPSAEDVTRLLQRPSLEGPQFMYGGLPFDRQQFRAMFGRFPTATELANSIRTSVGAAVEALRPTKEFVFGAKRAPEYQTLQRELTGERTYGGLMSEDVTRALTRGIKNDTWAMGVDAADSQTRLNLALKGNLNILPEGALRNVARDVRKRIDTLSKELADAGLVSPTKVAETQGKYLRQTYARDVLGGDVWANVITAEDRAAGIEYLLRNEQIKVGNFWRNVSLDEATAIADNIIREGHGGGIGARTRGATYGSTASPLRNRKGIPEPIQKLMGIIDDGVYNAARTIYDQHSLLATNKFLTRFAKGSEVINGERLPWFSETPRTGYTRVKMNDFSKRAFGKTAADDVYILDKYAKDFDLTHGVQASGLQQAFFNDIYSPIINTFKVSKTVLNPATHMRNVVGNVIFSAGAENTAINPANWKFYRQAFMSAIKRDPLYMEAVKNGSIGGQFTSAELKMGLENFHSVKQNPVKWLLNAPLRNPVTRAIGRVYSLEDEIFKLASYLKQRSLGFSEQQASLHVNRYFPRYDELTNAVQALRQGPGAVIGGPFISFSAEAMRISKNIAQQNPILFAALLGGIPAFTEAVAAYHGISHKQLKSQFRRVPPNLRGMFTMLLPWKDSKNNLRFVDATYWHPLGSLMNNVFTSETGTWTPFDFPLSGEFIAGNPIVQLALEVGFQTHLSPYRRGESLVRTGENPYTANVEHILRSIGPPLLPEVPGVTRKGGYAYEEIKQALLGRPGRYGQRKGIGEALLGELTPARPVAIDAEMSSYTAGLLRSELRRIDEGNRRNRSDFLKGKISASEYQSRVRRAAKDRNAVYKRFLLD